MSHYTSDPAKGCGLMIVGCVVAIISVIVFIIWRALQ
jgi:hypothetical protein